MQGIATRTRREIGLVVAGSLAAGLLAALAGLPAAWLIGPLLATLALALTRPLRLHIPGLAYTAAQAVVGAALSASFEPGSLAALVRFWPLVVGSVALIFGLSVVSGLLLARVAGLSAATAVLGMIPGGASGMVAMSDELGGNTPLVAFMQYARLCLVAVSAALLARYVVGGSGAAAATFAPAAVAHSWSEYAITTALTLVGAWAAIRLRMPAGALVGPVIVGVLAGLLGIAHGRWPPGVLPASNIAIGIAVGLRFNRATVRHVGRLLLPVLGIMLALIGGCALLAWGLVLGLGADGLSAYLATTPGGMDAVTIAALDSGADMALILPVQLLRLLVMVLAGPFLVRWIHRRAPATTLADEPDRAPRAR